MLQLFQHTGRVFRSHYAPTLQRPHTQHQRRMRKCMLEHVQYDSERIVPIKATKPPSSLQEYRHDSTVLGVSPQKPTVHSKAPSPGQRGERQSGLSLLRQRQSPPSMPPCTPVRKWVTGVFPGGLACGSIRLRSQPRQKHRHTAHCLPDMPCHASLSISAFVHPPPPPTPSLSFGATIVKSMSLLIPISLSLPFWPIPILLYRMADVYSIKDGQSLGQTRNQQSILQGRMCSQPCVRGGFSILSTCVEERMSTPVNNWTVSGKNRLEQMLHLWLKLYHNGSKVTVCVMRLCPPTEERTHHTLPCRVVPDGMKRPCSTDGRCLLSGLINGWLLYDSTAGLRTHTGIRLQADDGVRPAVRWRTHS